jgi:ubiquinone/menaquinone biosynthesis C-methylase UbiE
MAGFSESRLAAWLQNLVSNRREEAGLYREIAAQLPNLEGGRILDIGTGSGLQLRAFHERFPHTELYGLDLSAHAIKTAAKNLANLKVDLRVGSIAEAPFETDFFNLVSCNASLSYWKEPLECLNEIHRILKPGGSAHLFEPQQDFDLDEVMETIEANLADRSALRRWAAKSLNKFGLRRGSSLGMKLYSLDELQALVQGSSFNHRSTVVRTTLQNLPIFVELRLIKPLD